MQVTWPYGYRLLRLHAFADASPSMLAGTAVLNH